MLITCGQCQTQYKLDDSMIGSGGRDVRCTKCGFVWHFDAPNTSPAAKPAEVPSPSSVADDISQRVLDVLDSPLIDEPMPERMPDKKSDAMPTSLKPVTVDNNLPVMDHQPGGMSAAQYGASTFLLLVFATIIGLYFMRAPLVHHWPPVMALYDKMGFGVKAPGEGLQLSEMTSVQQALMLNISAKLSNISDADVHYPKMKVVMRSSYGAIVKEWPVAPEDVMIKAGDSVPVNLSLRDAPAEGKTVDLMVVGD